MQDFREGVVHGGSCVKPQRVELGPRRIRVDVERGWLEAGEGWPAAGGIHPNLVVRLENCGQRESTRVKNFGGIVGPQEIGVHVLSFATAFGPLDVVYEPVALGAAEMKLGWIEFQGAEFRVESGPRPHPGVALQATFEE